MKICISTGASAFKRSHYSRVQALCEFLKYSDFISKKMLLSLIIDSSSKHPIEILDIPYKFSKVHTYKVDTDLSSSNYFVQGFQTIYSVLRMALEKKLFFDACIASMIRGGFVSLILKYLGKINLLFYDDMDAYYLFYKGLTRKVVFQIERALIKHADVVFSVSKTLKSLREKQGARVVYWIPNGVDNSLFESAWKIRKQRSKISKKGALTLLYSGSLDPNIWGTIHILKVLKELKREVNNSRLIIIGGGDYLNLLVKEAKKMKIEKDIHFTGKIPHNTLPEFFSKADIGLAIGVPESPAVYADPIKIKEYMSAGLPVVGTNIGDIPTIINDADAGLVADFSVESIASRIVELYENPKEYYIKSENGRKYAVKNFDWRKIFSKMFRIIFATLEKG
ncbi:MAG: glycosyltransferase family 4 protein [Candidatus Asgardarchaeia archaeon]